MKVLLINNLFEWPRSRGAAASVQRLAQGLTEQQFEVVVANAPPVEQPRLRRVRGIRVYDIPYRPPTPGVAPALRQQAARQRLAMLREVMLKETPAIVHTNNFSRFSTPCWLLAQQVGIPVVHSLREYQLMCRNARRFVEATGPCQDVCADCTPLLEHNRKRSTAVDAVVGVSHHILQCHLDEGFFAAAQVQDVVYSAPGNLPQPAQAVAAETPLRCGYLGQMDATKGVQWLLQQLAMCAPEGWNLRLGGDDRQETATAIIAGIQQSNIHYEGFVQTPEFLAAIDLLIVPSLWEEPLGVVAIEALAAGVHVLTSGRGGLAELADLVPDCVTIYDPLDPESFQIAMRGFIATPQRLREQREQHGALGRQHFSDQALAAGYAAIYETLLT